MQYYSLSSEISNFRLKYSSVFEKNIPCHRCCGKGYNHQNVEIIRLSAVVVYHH